MAYSVLHRSGDCLSQRLRRDHRPPRRCRIAQARPFLERLEGRTLLSISWDSENHPDGGAWEDPGNWLNDMGQHATPTEFQDTFISGLFPGSSVTVTSHTSTAACRMLTTDDTCTLSIDGGMLLAGDGCQLGGPLEVNSGYLSLGKGSVVNSSFTWHGGTCVLDFAPDKPVQFHSLILLSGSEDKHLLGVLVNTNVIIQGGTGDLGMDAGILINQGTYQVTSDAGIHLGVFQNVGDFIKAGGSATSRCDCRFDNLGAGITVTSGTLELSNIQTWTGASFTIQSGSHLVLGSKDGRSRLSGGYGGAGGGDVRFEGGVFTVADQGVAFAFEPNTLQWTSGTFEGPGLFTLNPMSTLTISGDETKAFGCSVRNRGTIYQTGMGNVTLGRLENSGTYELQSDAGMGYLGFGQFVNSGTLRKSAGTGTSTLQLQLENQNGTIDVQAGTLSVSYLGNCTGGNFTTAFGTQLRFAGMADASDLTGDYLGSGEGQVSLDGRGLVLGPGGATFRFDPGVLQWVSGNILGGPLTNAGTLTVTGDASKEIDSLFINNGTILHRATGDVFMLALVNRSGAVYDLHSAGNIISGTFRGSIDNSGTFQVTGVALPSISCAFTNAPEGLLDVASVGGVRFAHDFNNAGTVIVEDGAGLGVNGTYTQTAGRTVLRKRDGASLVVSATVDVQGGSLEGDGSIVGNVRNASQVAPGGTDVAGVLSIAGNYTQTDTGTLSLELGGHVPGAEYDQLNANGMATISGTVDVRAINGFIPDVGDTFPLVGFSAIINSARVVNLPDLGDAIHFEVGVDSTEITLATVDGPPGLPPPGSNPRPCLSGENLGRGTVNAPPFLDVPNCSCTPGITLPQRRLLVIGQVDDYFLDVLSRADSWRIDFPLGSS